MICSDESETELADPTNAHHIPTPEQAFLGSELDELIELKNLPGCFSLLDSTEPDALPYAALVEQLFSSSFYTSLWNPFWARLVTNWLGEPLAYTVTHTPFRKFKAVLPWLSSACQETVLLDCLCAELLASLFYMRDDVIDKRDVRNGQETAYKLFGRNGMEASWKKAYQLDTPAAAPFFEGDEERQMLWEESLHKIAASENLRLEEQGSLSLLAYCNQSAQRTGFLGEWWQRAAARTGNGELYRVLGEIYPLCASVGQIRNDLCNIDEREEQNGGTRFSDFTDGRITAVTILVRKWADRWAAPQDRSWLHHHVWHSQRLLRADEIARLSAMCRESEVIERLTKVAEGSIQQIKEELLTSTLSEDLKALWSGWVFRQFHVRVTGHYWEGDSAACQFIQAVKRLSHFAEETEQRAHSNRDCPLPSAILPL